ncbi:MAG: SNF2 helicase-associated domain-containing protein [Elusimicrobiota bacterium]|nr:MAG: SNF2 helicase-associated domain-containing protein [Elusimicrobiota bacterium]
MSGTYIIVHSVNSRRRFRARAPLRLGDAASGPDALEAALRASGVARPLSYDSVPPWSERAVALDAAEAVDFLAAGAAKSGATLGPGLSFWIAALEFCASLVVRQRFVQAYALENSRFKSYWKPLCTGPDEQTFRELSARLPDAPLAEFMRDFAAHLMRREPRPASAPTAPAPAPAGPFKLCFRLEEPETASGAWRMSCLLQSTSDPSLLLPPGLSLGAGSGAPKILRREHYEVRERLLTALDHAGRVYPVARRSFEAPALDGFELDAHEAHDFLTHFAAPLEAAGFGVLLPAWWTRPGARPRLWARAKASRTGLQGAQGLTLDDAIRLDYEVALGADALTKEELDALAEAKAPLVRLRGRWVEADGEAIRAALAFWKSTQKGTVRDLVRLSLGGARAPTGLEIEDVSAEGSWAGSWIVFREKSATRPFGRPRLSPAACALTSSGASPGSPTSAATASAPASPTTWAWARPSRPWP